jgi:hypothetical protein
MKNLCQILRPHDQAVGILQKNASFSEVQPVSYLAIEKRVISTRIDMGNHCCGNLSPETKFLRNSLDILNNLTDFIDFPLYVGYRSAGEGSVFVDWTKQALVPWTVACQPQKQTLAFTWGSYGTLLDHRNPFSLKQH